MAIEISLAAISGFLDRDLSELRHAPEFDGVAFERFHEDDGDEFFQSGCRTASGAMEATCNRAGKVRAIFLHSVDDEEGQIALSEIPFAISRDELRQRFGQPEWARDAFEDEILGRYPPSDRFHFRANRCLAHCQYDEELDAVTQITLMPEDWRPGE